MDGDLGHPRLASMEALQRIIDAIPHPVFVKDRQHRLLLLNDATASVLGQPASALLGKSDFDIFPAEQARVFVEADDRALRSGLTQENEVSFTDGAGRMRTFIARKAPLCLGDDPSQDYILGVVSDITDVRESEARLRYLAYNDTLTGIGNRAQLVRELDRIVVAARRTRRPFAVLYVDLDRFKTVNDLFGHAGGDEVLREAARRLMQATRVTDVLARLGGDEFVVIQTEIEGPAGTERLAARLVEVLSAEYRLHSGQLAIVSASIGIAMFPDDGEDAEGLLRSADAALYRIKTGSRNGFAFFQAEMDTALRARHSLEYDLGLALSRNEFSLVYQPQSEAATRRILGFEALLRWRHPQRGAVPPSEFIPAAEACGAIIPIGAWVLAEACREAARWSVPLRIAVNVSAVQIHHGQLARYVEEALASSGLDPSRLEIEVTESLVIRDRDLALETLHRLKEMGVSIALDDFGTGYSSLSTLSAFPFDRVKVDRSFVQALPHSAEAAAIVRAVLGLGRGLGLPVMAEGVETEAQLAALRRDGCGEVQGFLIARPQPISAYRGIISPDAAPARTVGAA